MASCVMVRYVDLPDLDLDFGVDEDVDLDDLVEEGVDLGDFVDVVNTVPLPLAEEGGEDVGVIAAVSTST